MASVGNYRDCCERMLARYLACEAERIYERRDGSAELGLLLAASSLETRPTPQGYGAAQRGLRLSPRRVSSIPPVRKMWAVAANGAGTIVFAGHGMPVQARDASTGRELWRSALDSYVTTLAFSPEGSVIIAGCVDGSVRVLDAETGRQTGVLKGGYDVVAVTASAGGTHVAIATPGRMCTVWRCGEKPVSKSLDCGNDVASLALTADGGRLATGSRGGVITLWDPGTREKLGRLRQRGTIQCLSFGRGDRVLLSGSREGLASVWDWAERREAERFDLAAPVAACRLSRDGTLFMAAAESGLIRVWRLADGQEVARCEHGPGLAAAALGEAGEIIAAGLDAGTSVWRMEETRAGLLHPRAVLAVAASADGGRIATSCDDRRTRVWDTASQAVIAEFAEAYPARSLALDESGELLAASPGDRRASVWEVASGRLIAGLEHPSGVGGLAFWGKNRLATAGFDGVARIWDVRGGAPREVRHEREVTDVAFSERGLLATSSWDGTARVWEADSGAELLAMRHAGPVEAVAISRDGGRVATASGDTVKLFEMSGRGSASLPHGAAVTGLAMTASGAQLSTVCRDGTARVWDCGTGEELVRIPHRNAAASVSFCAEGHAIVVAANEPEAPMWTVDTWTMLAQAKERVTRELTAEERREYFQGMVELCRAERHPRA